MKLKLIALPILMTCAAKGGTFANITIDGDFSDWATIPVSYTDPNEGFAYDINTIQIANNDTNLFIRITFNQAVNPNSGNGLFLAFDNDSNPTTGYDTYGMGLIGAEAAYQNDFPFQQTSGIFNTGSTTNASIAISPYSVDTLSQEFSISRSAVINTATNDLVFPNSSFNFAAYFNDSDSDFAGPVSYTFAIPETSTAVLFGGFVLFSIMRRRRATA